MVPLVRTFEAAVISRRPGRSLQKLSVSLALIGVMTAVGIAAFRLHLNLSAVGSIYMLLVVLTALRWGLLQATVASFASVLCMNYLFIPPIFRLQIADSQNWISLATFETAALFVSSLSSKVVEHAQHAEVQRERTSKLYELSRAILLIDSRSATGDQLAALVREIVNVESVRFWVLYDSVPASSPNAVSREQSAPETVFHAGKDTDEDSATSRILRIGTTHIGAMVLQGWRQDPLLADAVASLAAIAFERARAIHRENRAEAERNIEQLRSAVLDGLAHGFKTPLTAIQTASSGLLTLDHLTPVQSELVSIIDEEATMLDHLTTRLLQTAALESRHIRLHRARTSVPAFLESILALQNHSVRARLKVSAPEHLISIDFDQELVRLAVEQLMDNAHKYSYVGSPIGLILLQDDKETTLIVENAGPLIPLEERERIFDRFYRGINAAHGPSGTGLGLSVVKKTAEAHGGKAWVECDHAGTRFCFTIENYRGVSLG